MALATFLIIISCVNFTNLAIVQATGRAKEVGVKKVLGAFRFTLAKQFLAETAMQCLLAFFIALVSVELLLPTVNTMLATELTLFTNEQLKVLLLQSLGIVLSIVVLAGLYPALFLSGFMPAKVLKGNFSGNLGTVTLRKGLMILQFTIAGVLVDQFFDHEQPA
ncbi:ABC transporter permease [Pedobacter sp. UC225_65]|uniref:ABC transporter permease n=1 Tax=Pedobacter sp. UC225_65 TaxID=3350173 RepID=UPI00366F0078